MISISFIYLVGAFVTSLFMVYETSNDERITKVAIVSALLVIAFWFISVPVWIMGKLPEFHQWK